MVPQWEFLIRFLGEDDRTYLASLPSPEAVFEIVNSTITGFVSYQDLLNQKGTSVKVQKVRLCSTWSASELGFQVYAVC